jgi:hypothetical protein
MARRVKETDVILAVIIEKYAVIIEKYAVMSERISAVLGKS